MSQDKVFSPLRAYLWPIHSYELRKFLPLLMMAFFIGFNYNILRNMKDAFLVTAADSGAEVIPFIKVWGIVPAAILMMVIYTRLNNRFTRAQVFYVMVGIFLVFFALFTFVIYPIRESLHPHKTADFLQSYLPTGFKGLIAMFRYWTFSSFYIMAELWSSAVLSMLFWGFANEVTPLGEAKRFYGLIAIGLNMAAIISGQIAVFLSGNFLRSKFIIVENPWHQSIILLTCVVILSGFIILGIFRFCLKSVSCADTQNESPSSLKPPKIRMSMRENFAYLARSKYLIYIAVIVFSYNVVINLVEVVWKDQVRQFYPSPNDFNAFQSQITTITGIISFFTSLLISGQVIRRFGWTYAALITPIILLLTSVGFFFFFLGRAPLAGILSMLGTSPLALVVFFGSAQNCLARASKFTLFDTTKEMAFIPLSIESKLKGKAAIDGVGSRLGKSGGSMIHQGLLVIFSTIAASAHIVAGFVLAVIVFWLFAVLSLGKQFNTVTGVNAVAQPSSPPPEAVKAPEEALT